MEQGRAIYACDIGSCRKGNFAWARIGSQQSAKPSSSRDIEALVSFLQTDLTAGLNIALGFEAPLFVPVPKNPNEFGRSRAGEGNRPFSAGAGASAALIGLQETTWIMHRLRDNIEKYKVIVDWQLWPPVSSTILLWEAFVSGSAKGECHTDDAVTAALEFQQREASLHSDVTCERTLSLVGAAAVWSGFSADLALLKKPVLVLRTTKRFEAKT